MDSTRLPRSKRQNQESGGKDFTHFYEMISSDNPDGRGIVRVGSYFEGIGVLVREGLINVRLVSLFLYGEVKWFWEKYGPYFKEHRVVENYPRAWIEAEYLYNQVIEYGKENLQQS